MSFLNMNEPIYIKITKKLNFIIASKFYFEHCGVIVLEKKSQCSMQCNDIIYELSYMNITILIALKYTQGRAEIDFLKPIYIKITKELNFIIASQCSMITLQATIYMLIFLLDRLFDFKPVRKFSMLYTIINQSININRKKCNKFATALHM